MPTLLSPGGTLLWTVPCAKLYLMAKQLSVLRQFVYCWTYSDSSSSHLLVHTGLFQKANINDWPVKLCWTYSVLVSVGPLGFSKCWGLFCVQRQDHCHATDCQNEGQCLTSVEGNSGADTGIPWSVLWAGVMCGSFPVCLCPACWNWSWDRAPLDAEWLQCTHLTSPPPSNLKVCLEMMLWTDWDISYFPTLQTYEFCFNKQNKITSKMWCDAQNRSGIQLCPVCECEWHVDYFNH